MSAAGPRPDVLLGVNPCGTPDARMCAAVSAAGGLGVIDLGCGDARSRNELVRVVEGGNTDRFGVRVDGECALTYEEVAELLGDSAGALEVVVLGWDAPWEPWQIADRVVVLVEVASRQEAVVARESGADGVVAKGNEAGGRVGELGSFVLLQQLLSEPRHGLPVWVCGGIGPQTAAAAVTGGAAGVVLDTQLALLPESELPGYIRGTLAASDGTDSRVVDGRRVIPARVPGTGRGAGNGGAGAEAVHIVAGQDAGLATRFVEHYGGVARAVRSVLAAMHGTAEPGNHADLRAGSPLSGRLGGDLPIAQGPMTRVSDQADFAAAVAGAGATPYLALALSSGEQVSDLLERTDARLGERPWGVGILGFAPDDLRAAQLNAVLRFRPRTAVIAGGRPDQARDLEDAGISTFLHVPSPGLLEQFLDAGARKFVFEGSECGGHVGPRSCFTLWQQQLGVLRDFIAAGGAGEELEVLFAGGIHDARSSAMVSAMAGPLAGEGAAVGILMGTAYLFTEEAVACGAVGPVFQQVAREAQHTELLETAPGHATRCVESPFTSEFTSIAANLRDQGLDRRAVWERLEQLNVGRLRIASKGVRRDGDSLVAVDDAEQHRSGMFMAGQVATLRHGLTTLAELHEEVTGGAAAFRDASIDRIRRCIGDAESPPEPEPLDIAIVGMSSMFPQAATLEEYWSNVVSNVGAITEVPPERWDVDTYFVAQDAPATPTGGDSTPSKWGGFLPDIPFDPTRFGIPPGSLASIEPVQLLALHAADRALVDAGYARTGFDRSRTGVVFGAAAGSDLANAKTLRMVLPSYSGELPEELDNCLPRLTEDSLPGRLSNVIAGRIANRLDLGGSNYTIDAACAASLAALDTACKELATNSADMMLCGGADLHNAIEDYLLFASVGALSPTGSCKTFDSSADGIALGEGVACLALKRLSDAERDGDRVYAVIKGVAGGSDGKALGLTAPRPEGQRRALDRAYGLAGVSPRQVGLVEAHGTGTVVGDRTELTTLTTLFDEAGTEPGSCVLGSVKSQIGHTMCAAGLAGLIKSAMAIYTGILPPTRAIGEPNHAWSPEHSPFVFREQAVPWAAAPRDRIAGVSAFGFGGTNFHAVLAGHSAADSNRHGLWNWPAELFTFRGADRASAHGELEWLSALVETNESHGRPWRLRDLACTASARSDRGTEPVQVAIVAADLDELAGSLRAALDGRTDVDGVVFRATGEEPEGKLAVLFPGQGSQYPGMMAELFGAFDELRRIAVRDPDTHAAMFPPAAFDAGTARDQRERLRDTRMAQPALGVTGLGVHYLLGRLGIRPDAYAGHSYGELVALAAAGAIDEHSLPALSKERADAMVTAAGSDPGGMAAVRADRETVDGVLDGAPSLGSVVVANYNAPGQVVVSGPATGLDRAIELLSAMGLPVTRLNVACAFHSPVVEDAAGLFATALEPLPVGAPRTQVWSNRTASAYPGDGKAVRSELAAQIAAPVDFCGQIEAMYADGFRVFLEAGPGSVLGGLVGAVLGDRPHTVVGCDEAGGGLRGFLRAAATLAVSGSDVRTGWLFTGRDARDVSTSRAPGRPRWTVNGHLARTADGKVVPGGLFPADEVKGTVMFGDGPVGDTGPTDEVMSEFLRNSREMVAAQRDVMLSYLGADPGVPLEVPGRTDGERRAMDAGRDADRRTGQDDGQLQEPPPERRVPDDRVGADAGGQASAGDELARVVDVLARRTGYPPEMIEPDLDLEADLSVDSIKRTEVAGELIAGSPGGAPVSAEDLARTRTARAMAEALSGSAATAGTAPDTAGRDGAAGESATPAGENADAPATPVDAGRVPATQPPVRHVLRLEDAEAGDTEPADVLVGARVAVVGGCELAEHVADELSARGATAWVVADGTRYAAELESDDGDLDGLVVLNALDNDAEPSLPRDYPLFRCALARRPRWVLAVAPHGNGARASLGLRGLVRTLYKEHPGTRVRLVEVDRDEPVGMLASTVLSEMLTAGPDPVVAVEGGSRRSFRMVVAERGAPHADDRANGRPDPVSDMGLGPDSVVLLIGGARGITARVAQRLAADSGCRIRLAGRTPPPSEPEDAELAAAADLPALRSVLARRGRAGPQDIDLQAREILARREVTDTLAELSETAADVRYHTVDVTEPGSVRGLVKEIYAEDGRIDGVVYAAGVIEDRLVADKDTESFQRVYSTKVDGAGELLEGLADGGEPPSFVVLFGSIAAALGNRGQADYAAANDALEGIAARSPRPLSGRVRTIHWGPWAPAAEHGGMVTPELERSYAERGVSLMDPDAAIGELFAELAWGPADGVPIVTASGW
ncbi:Acyl transferase domain-containing protein [Haloechinothrix alba]|uniref:Acyl transferase domain-containing protein n=1 Tax=Haloechinothrix alba TaxID=664784 RepID=A0A238VHS1_9PSEU|nr:type I polyketide synthase [Haloechinothrix alba]SNR33223.1 Acyl transferase domain-containing protein [Haloechinothrix alba]